MQVLRRPSEEAFEDARMKLLEVIGVRVYENPADADHPWASSPYPYVERSQASQATVDQNGKAVCCHPYVQQFATFSPTGRSIERGWRCATCKERVEPC